VESADLKVADHCTETREGPETRRRGLPWRPHIRHLRHLDRPTGLANGVKVPLLSKQRQRRADDTIAG
jgi:hypothetical protein